MPVQWGAPELSVQPQNLFTCVLEIAQLHMLIHNVSESCALVANQPNRFLARGEVKWDMEGKVDWHQIQSTSVLKQQW